MQTRDAVRGKNIKKYFGNIYQVIKVNTSFLQTTQISQKRT
jgi:hypothetical protein